MLVPLQGWVSLGPDPMTVCRGEVGASWARQKGGSPTLACFLVGSFLLPTSPSKGGHLPTKGVITGVGEKDPSGWSGLSPAHFTSRHPSSAPAVYTKAPGSTDLSPPKGPARGWEFNSEGNGQRSQGSGGLTF